MVEDRAFNAPAEGDSFPTRSSLLFRLRDLADDVSWRRFFETYWRLIYKVACKSGLSNEDAQDVVQETVIAVSRRMPDFRYDPQQGSFKQWLLLITRRRIHDRLRRLYRTARVEEPGSGFSEVDEPADPALPPDAQIAAAWETEWRENILHAALARVRQSVNPKHFQVFDCCVLQKLPVAQVAQILGINAAQVYLARHRVNAALKRAIAKIEAEVARSGTACLNID
jgi:RNA polymerase sigma factor (sigma-70 family)